MSEVFNPVINRVALMKQVGDNLNKIRVTMEWSQAKMAKLTGVAEPTIGNYLKGERLPDIDYIVNLCAMESIKKKGINLKFDDLLSNSFDPEKAIKAKSGVAVDGVEVSEHKDFVGCYLCYFYDQSKPVNAQDSKTTRELRFGVLSVFDDYNSVTGEQKMRAFASFYRMSEMENAVKAKKAIDVFFKSKDTVDIRNNLLYEYYTNEQKVAGIYEGDVVFSSQHTFINIKGGVHNDNALIVLYSPKKRPDIDYLGGIGSVASVAHGNMHMPCAQKIIVSRYELRCSFEEIADHLSLSSAPISQTEEAMAITEICRKLYVQDATTSDGEKISVFGYLDERDKVSIIENRLNQLVRNYIEKNVCCVGSVSEEEDKKVYSLIKRYVN